MRTVVLGNQRLLVNLDEHLCVRDIFYKRVGQENHVLGTPHRIGVWHENTVLWLDEPGWEFQGHASCALCSTTTATHAGADITLTFQDVVLKDHDVFIRRVQASRSVRLFFYQYYFLYGDGIGDCAAYDPVRSMLFHYKRHRYFTFNAFVGTASVIDDYTVSVPDAERHAWRDALDGVLSKNAIAQGTVDSCAAFVVPEHTVVDVVVCAEQSLAGMRALHDTIAHADRNKLVNDTLYEQHTYCMVPETLRALPAAWLALYETSVLLIRAHCDSDGGITAANDSDNMQFNRDTYSYVWGRDGALVACTLSEAGKTELVENYFRYCLPLCEPEGYYMHKHHPDGSLGSSWHAWVRDGKPYLPIQEDSTALLLYALHKHHMRTQSAFIMQHYETWVVRMIDFLLRFIDEGTGLPFDCWDLWEERQGIHTWTVASVIAGLQAGAYFASQKGDAARVTQCTHAAERMKQGMLEQLYAQSEQGFMRRRTPTGEADYTVDAASLAPFLFGVLEASHEAVLQTAKAVGAHLRTPQGGIARYQGDYYHRCTEEAPGNAWLICTLWLAQHHIALGELQAAHSLIDWVASKATFAGMLAEQVHPITGVGIGVCPLTWSHATFMDTLHLYAQKQHETQ